MYLRFLAIAVIAVYSISGFAQKKNNDIIKRNTVVFAGTLDSAWRDDTVVVRVFKSIYSLSSTFNYDYAGSYTDYFLPVINGSFFSRITSIEEIKYTTLFLKNESRNSIRRIPLFSWGGDNGSLSNQVDVFLLEPGDSIVLRFGKIRGGSFVKGATSKRRQYLAPLSFSGEGKGFAKIDILRELHQIEVEESKKVANGKIMIWDERSFKHWDDSLIKKYMLMWQITSNVQQSYLENNKGLFSKKAFDVLEENIKYHNLTMSLYDLNYRDLQLHENYLLSRIDKSEIDRMIRFVNNIIVDSFTSFEKLPPPRNGTYSTGYKEYFFKNLLMRKKMIDTSINLVAEINRKFTGRIRTNFLLTLFNDFSRTQNLIVDERLEKVLADFSEDELSTFQQIRSRNLESVKMKNFSFQNINGDTVSLYDFAGKVIVMDIWYTGCPGCAALYKNVLKKLEQDYKTNTNVIFLSVAIDPEFDFWRRSIKSGMYTNPDQENVVNLFSKKDHSNAIVNALAIRDFPEVFLLNKKTMIVPTRFLDDFRENNDNDKFTKLKSLIDGLVENPQ